MRYLAQLAFVFFTLTGCVAHETNWAQKFNASLDSPNNKTIDDVIRGLTNNQVCKSAITGSAKHLEEANRRGLQCETKAKNLTSKNVNSTSAQQNENMRPLRYVLEQEKSPQMLVYAYERCSGLFGAAYAAFASSERDGAEQIAATFLLKSADATLAAVELAQQHNINLSMKQSQSNAIRIMDKYKDAMTRTWDLTGNQFSPEILDDQDQCLALLDSKSKGTSASTNSISPKLLKLEPSGFQKSEMESQAPEGCRITALMDTETEHTVGQQLTMMITEENHLGVVLDGVLRMPNGRISKLKNLNGRTTSDLSRWQKDEKLGFVIIGKEALNFTVDYLNVSGKFAGWMLERNAFDLENDFIFMRFEDGGTTYTAPLLFGKREPQFTQCIEETTAELLKRRGG